MICKGCGEAYDEELFPVCPFCLTENKKTEVDQEKLQAFCNLDPSKMSLAEFAKAIMKTIDRIIYAEEQKEYSIETEVLGDDVKLPAETKEDKDAPNIDELPRDDGDIDI